MEIGCKRPTARQESWSRQANRFPSDIRRAPAAAGRARWSSIPSRLQQPLPHCPSAIACAASATAFNPEPQTWLTVMLPPWKNPSANCSLPSRVLAQPGLQHASHNAFVDLFRFNPGAEHGFAHNQTLPAAERKRIGANPEICRPACGQRRRSLLRSCFALGGCEESHRLFRCAPPARRSRISSPSKTRDRIKNRSPSGPSSENMPPRPGTTSSVSCVCFQYSNWLRLM